MIKRYGKNKLNGSVLYTVVAVMMIMTVFIFAALSLASAANRRAFNSYANNQTQYTARSVVDSMMKILRENGEKAVGSVDCDLLNASLDSSMGKVTSAEIIALDTIENLEKAGYNFGLNLTKEQKKNYVYKLSATVKMLGQENTVTLYCYNGKEDNPPVFKNALTIMGKTDFAPCDTIPVYGDVYTSVDNPMDVNVGKGNSQPLYINGTYGTKGNLLLYGGGNAGLRVHIDDFNKGIYVDENIGLLGNSMHNELKFIKDVNNVSYTTLPYAFINGTFGGNFVDNENISQTSGKQNYMSIGDSNHPFIFMADSLGCQGAQDQFNAYADVYLYSETTPSYIMVNSESSPIESGVHSWNSEKVDIANPNGNKYTGGNIYSMGELNVETYNKGTDDAYGGTLANNVVAKSVNFSGHGWSTMNYKTTGAVVADSVNLSSAEGSNFNYTFYGGLFTNYDKFNVSSGQTVNEITFVGDHIDYNVEKSFNGDKEFTNPDINNKPIHLNGDEAFIYFDFSDKLSENGLSNDDFDNIYTYGNSDKLLVKEIKIDISPLDYQYYYSDRRCKIVCDIYSYTSEKISSFNIDYDLDGGVINIPYIDAMYTNDIRSVLSGTIKLHFYPYDEYDKNNEIMINSVSFVLSAEVTRRGDVKVSGMDKLELIKQANDNAFAWNGNVIYIDDIDKSVKLEKDGSVMRISTAKNDNSTYTLIDEFDYDTRYIDFLNAVVSTVTFPDSMKKDKVIDTNGGFVSTSFMSESFRKQIVSNAKTYTDVESEFKDVDTYLANHTDWTKVDKDGNTSSVTINESNPITENCILGCTSSNSFGNGNNAVLYINPPENKTIYIGLYNFKVTSGTHLVVVDDDNGKVIFFVPKSGMEIKGTGETTGNGINWTGTNNVSVLTKSLFQKLYVDDGTNYNMTSAKIDINDLTVKSPNIYFYFDNDEELNMTLGNGSLIAGYIYGSNVNYRVESGALFANGTNLPDDVIKINILGSGIFKSAFIQESNYVYIEEGSSAETPPDSSDIGVFTTMYYQSY
ncbi:MAG: hypothetical protein MR503_02880 [Oscillospiraceae bacterium]|nr:hypothetical protein [Oscillospiraceae bacterium]